ncbi:MAG TPA: glycosyltransferase family 39 protein [Tepidisphaeraceae bacterium]
MSEVKERAVAPAETSRRMLLALWVLSGLALFSFLGHAPVQRAQEARVMETARELLGAPLGQWMIPKLNGEPRLRKPPLAYWLAAGSFKIMGVNNAAGRIPTVLAGWLMVGITYAIGTRLFSHRAGLFAAGALAGSYMFFRYTRLAETDALAALGVTAAMWGLLRCCEEVRDRRMMLWAQLAAVGIAWAAMSKGPPAAYPVLFLIIVCALERTAMPAWRFLRTGAVVTALVLALPWWLYVYFGPGSQQINEEVQLLTSGEFHGGPWVQYVPLILVATAPWTGFIVYSLIAAGLNWRGERKVRLLIAWIAGIFVPLCFLGNKQPHYLFPLMPPLMLLAGWAVDADLRRHADRCAKIVLWLVRGTAAVLVLAGIAVAGMGPLRKMPVTAADGVLGVAVVTAAMAVLLLSRSRRALLALGATGVLSCVLMPALIGLWVPNHFERDPQGEALILRSNFRRGPYYFYGAQVSLPLVFAMRQEIPVLRSEAAAREKAGEANVVVLVIEKEGKDPAAPPPPFEKVLTARTDRRSLTAYQVKRAAATQP